MAEAFLQPALDEIWVKPKDAHEIARAEIDQFEVGQWVALAACDAAAIAGPRGGSIQFHPEPRFEIQDSSGATWMECEVRAQPSDVPVVIEYPASHRYVAVLPLSRVEPRVTASHDAAEVLVALELIRDHLDSALLHPPTARDERIDSLAHQAHLD